MPCGCPKQNENLMKLIRLACCQLEKLSVRPRQSPKHQINYSNQQYNLLIANKHKKLLIYDLFEGLIEDLGERNERMNCEPDIGVKEMEGIFVFALFS